MRGTFLAIWLLVPLGAAAYHYGPGLKYAQLDNTDDLLAAAGKAVTAGRHGEAVDLYGQALASLPADRQTDGLAIRLERAKSQLLSGQLPAAYNELDSLLGELQADPKVDSRLLADARETEANTKYYVTWLMRLEGRPREEWEPEIESARQGYRFLAEQAAGQGTQDDVERQQDNLEAAIRLERLDLSKLQALSLPSQCQGCKSGQCNCKCRGKGKKQSSGKKPSRGAGLGPAPDESGN